MSVPTTFAARCSCANPRVTNSCHFQADRRNLRRGLCIPVSLVPVMAVVLLPGVSGGPGLNHAQANMAAPWAYHDDQRGDEVPLAQGKPTRQRHVRDGETYEDDTLRIVVSAPEGMFLVYDALLPADAQRWSPGYLAYWYDFEDGLVHVYGRLLFEQIDLGHALLNLQADLGINASTLTSTTELLAEALTAAKDEAGDPALWHPATRPLLLELMGFDVPQGLDDTPLPVPGWFPPGDEEEPIGGVSSCPDMVMVGYFPAPRLTGEVKESAGEALENLLDFIGGVTEDARCPGGCDDKNECTDDSCNRR